MLVMTHAAKPPPDGPSGAMAYDAYINHRMSALQQGVRCAVADPAPGARLARLGSGAPRSVPC